MIILSQNYIFMKSGRYDLVTCNNMIIVNGHCDLLSNTLKKISGMIYYIIG